MVSKDTAAPGPIAGAIYDAINSSYERKGRRVVSCRLCGQRRPRTRHHLVPQRWLRPGRLHLHEPALNLIDLCAGCHRLVDGAGRLRIAAPTHRARLRAVLTDAEVAYGSRVLGQEEFDRMYPVAEDSPLDREAEVG